MYGNEGFNRENEEKLKIDSSLVCSPVFHGVNVVNSYCGSRMMEL